MTEISGRDVGRIEGRLDEFIATRVARDKHTDERFDRLEAKVQKLLDAANMGAGAWWFAVKVGGSLTAIGAGFMWLLEKMRW